ncbi:MAG: winged helix-turn-helix transcriptional regulator [Candidatus Bathyarchaeia archaeon]
MRKELPQQLLRELLKNSRRSDRELAKVLKVSQPTITRTRHRLEKDGLIEDYTIIPNFRSMGFELLTINFAKLKPGILLSEIKDRANEYIAKFPNTLFASGGAGMGMNAVSISLFRNFTEYQERVNLFRTEWKEIIADLQSFIVPIGEEEFKRFSLAHLKGALP